jgi:GNAT superfamily N-acetyltransferase
MIRRCEDKDFEAMYVIINDAAQAYRGVIPSDRWKEPYMPMEELRDEIRDGVEFQGYESGGRLVGIMGIQEMGDVALIRHAYVSTGGQRKGIGGRILGELTRHADRPLLVGTWSDAVWAIRFYEKYGFRLVSAEEKDRLLKKYWNIPERQIETSVVLADDRYFTAE